MIAYKAVHKDMHSDYGERPVYQTGVRYTYPAAQRGAAGFHAAEDPLFCLSFIRPDQGRYFRVELQGELDAGGCEEYDTATAATSITFLEELSVEQMLWESLRYRLAWAKKGSGERSMTVARRPGQTVTAQGRRSVAVAQGPATTAIASGQHSLAIAEGAGATATAHGEGTLAVAYGKDATASATHGAWVLLIDPTAPAGRQLKAIH